jgi:hypothetical protein
VSSTDSVVWVMKASFAGSRTCEARHVGDRLDQQHAPSGSCPMVPMVSGWPAWPIITICRPFSWCRAASIWTLLTSGQVAST